MFLAGGILDDVKITVDLDQCAFDFFAASSHTHVGCERQPRKARQTSRQYCNAQKFFHKTLSFENMNVTHLPSPASPIHSGEKMHWRTHVRHLTNAGTECEGVWLKLSSICTIVKCVPTTTRLLLRCRKDATVRVAISSSLCSFALRCARELVGYCRAAGQRRNLMPEGRRRRGFGRVGLAA